MVRFAGWISVAQPRKNYCHLYESDSNIFPEGGIDNLLSGLQRNKRVPRGVFLKPEYNIVNNPAYPVTLITTMVTSSVKACPPRNSFKASTTAV